jgi:hypothetical protein
MATERVVAVVRKTKSRRVAVGRARPRSISVGWATRLTMAQLASEKAHGSKVKEFARFEQNSGCVTR